MSTETVHFEKERGVTEVQVSRGIAHITLTLASEALGQGRLDILKRFAEANVPVFLVKLLPAGLSFALRPGQRETGVRLLGELQEELKAEFELRPELGLVTTRAGAMRDLSGVMATIYEALVAEGIVVHQTGDTYNAVHCLVPGDAADRAAAALRQRFALGNPNEPSPDAAEVRIKAL